MPKEYKECRACLSQLVSEPGHSLFKAWYTPWAVRGAIIADDLAKLADIEISVYDEFSKVICTPCYKRLSEACTFMITVQMNDNILRSRLKGVTSGTIGNITGNDDLPYSSNTTNSNTESRTNNIDAITGHIETVTGNVETITGDIDNLSWPQPIQVHKSTSLQLEKSIEVEVKQEVLSEEENGLQMEQDWEPMMDIKIEPEEIVAPVLQQTIHFNGANDDGPGSNGFTEYLDSTVKQEVMSGDELQEDAPDLPLDCMLCSKEFHSVSGLKAHVIANHSYGSVKRKADTLPKCVESRTRDTTCHTCDQRFQTATDLMVHAHSHSEHVCYVCGAKFRTFLQLSRHGPSCASKRTRGKHAATARPPSRPPKPFPTNKDEITVQTTVVLTKQETKNLPWVSKMPDQKVEANGKSPAVERMVVESIEELVKREPEKEIDMDIEQEKSDNVSTSLEMEQEVIKLKIIDKPPEDISTEKSKEISYKIKIGPKTFERTEEKLKESESAINDKMNIDSGQRQTENSYETDIAKSGKDASSEIDRISETIEDTQFDDGVPIDDNIKLENRLIVRKNAVEQEKNLDKSLIEQMSIKSVERLTEPILDQELKSLTDLLEESNSNISETNVHMSRTEVSSSTSKNVLKSDKIPELKELAIETINTHVYSDSSNIQCHHQCEDTLKTNQEVTNEAKDSIEQEMDKIFEEQTLVQENLNADQNTIPVIPKTPENLNELSEMKVHLAINPLNKDTELFDADVKVTDLDRAKSEAKLVTVSEQSDTEHS